MNNPMSSPTFLAVVTVVRALLIATGAVRGFMTDDALTEFTSALIVLVPVLWGVAEQYYLDTKTKAREVIALTAGLVIADATVGPTPTIAPVDVPYAIKDISPQIIVTGKNSPPLVRP